MEKQNRSAQKRERQQKRRYQRNRHDRTRMKTAIRKVLSSSDKEEAKTLYSDAVSLIDQLTGKGIIHKNTAARRKSALSRHLKSLS